nr:LpqN/LpqT family lipoprotein [Cellulosimicrobium arenosum]
MAVVTGVGAACAGCGSTGTDEPPDGASTATSAASPVQVPGVPVTVTLPPGWDDQAREGAFVLVAPAPQDPGAVRTNVVVTGEQTTEAVEEAAAESASYAESLPGWTLDDAGPQEVTVAEVPALGVVGTYEADGVRVAQEVYVLEAGTGGDRQVVRLTVTTGAGDETAAAQVREVLDGVEISAAVTG